GRTTVGMRIRRLPDLSGPGAHWTSLPSAHSSSLGCGGLGPCRTLAIRVKRRPQRAAVHATVFTRPQLVCQHLLPRLRLCSGLCSVDCLAERLRPINDAVRWCDANLSVESCLYLYV